MEFLKQGLEVIEAHYLFGAEYDDIEIVIHPQSIIHSMIETQVLLLEETAFSSSGLRNKESIDIYVIVLFHRIHLCLLN